MAEHQPKSAENRCWNDCLRIILDETTAAFAECLAGLSDEDLWRRPVEARHSIGTMAMHCLDSLSGFACWAQVGRGVPGVGEEDWFDLWAHTPAELDERQRAVSLPGAAQMLQWLEQVRQIAFEGLEASTEDELRGYRAHCDWCVRTGRSAAAAYMRCLMHTASHIRQIWCLRGAMGRFGPENWPEQHYA